MLRDVRRLSKLSTDRKKERKKKRKEKKKKGNARTPFQTIYVISVGRARFCHGPLIISRES
jgi:hypothetical protein